jgi:hypothetical protein
VPVPVSHFLSFSAFLCRFFAFLKRARGILRFQLACHSFFTYMLSVDAMQHKSSTMGANAVACCAWIIPLTERLGYSPAEFAALYGRHPSWAYRLLYGGKVKALTDLGRILIPASELERVLATAAPYNPKPRKHKPQGPPTAQDVPGTPESHSLLVTSLSRAPSAKVCDTRLEVQHDGPPNSKGRVR